MSMEILIDITFTRLDEGKLCLESFFSSALYCVLCKQSSFIIKRPRRIRGALPLRSKVLFNLTRLSCHLWMSSLDLCLFMVVIWTSLKWLFNATKSSSICFSKIKEVGWGLGPSSTTMLCYALSLTPRKSFATSCFKPNAFSSLMNLSRCLIKKDFKLPKGQNSIMMKISSTNRKTKLIILSPLLLLWFSSIFYSFF
jgi:hypothetical protein